MGRANQIVFYAMILALVSCKPYDHRSVIGEFKYNYDDVLQLLTIYPNGSYHSVVYRNGIATFDSSGHWRAESVGGYNGVTFDNFYFPDRKINENFGYWFVEPEIKFGKICLCFDSDEDKCFKKIRELR